MRKLIFILAVLISLSSRGQNHIYITAGGDGGAYYPGLAVAPGDYIHLAKMTYFYPGEIHGTILNPIHILIDDTLTSGITLENCTYIDVNGQNTGVIYGGGRPYYQRDNAGVGIGLKSAHITIRNTKFKDNGFSIVCKNESTCDTSINNWVLDDIQVYSNVFDGAHWEHLYFGSTNSPLGIKRPINCSGHTTRPSRLGNIIVRDNTFKTSGRAAIQVANATVGTGVTAYNNTIRDAGRETEGQGNGINIGYSKVNIHDNNIRGTLGVGIAVYTGRGSVVDNVIDSSGYKDGVYTTIWAWGIWIDDDDVTPPTDSMLNKFTITGNQIGHRGNGAAGDNGWNDIQIGSRYGVNHAVKTWDNGTVISGNTSTVTGQAAKIFIDPSIDWDSTVTVVKSVFRRGYYTDSKTGRRVYYILYTDKTWTKANSKYQPID